MKLSIKGFKRKLYIFQNEGVALLERFNGRALLADEPGLGKTIQALAWLWLRHKDTFPVMVVCPAALKLNWRKEIRKSLPRDIRVQIASSRTPARISGDINIINYDIVKYWIGSLRTASLKSFVLDESHNIKNTKAKRTRALASVVRDVSYLIAISGTPITDRPANIFTTLNFLYPEEFPSLLPFAIRYCNLRHTKHGWDYSGATNTKELHTLLVRAGMIRRKKKDVLKQLPIKTRAIVPIELSNRAEYDKAENETVNWLRGNHSCGKKLLKNKFEALKQLAIKGKVDYCLQWIADFLQSGEKLVVFATHRSTIRTLHETFGRCSIVIEGKTPSKDRHHLVHRFQHNDKIRLAICNVTAGGTGSTLTAASNVAFIEEPWSPAEVSQGEDRTHRIGQTKPVTAWHLIAEDTVEESIIKLLDKKQKILDEVLDGQSSEGEFEMMKELTKALIMKAIKRGKSA